MKLSQDISELHQLIKDLLVRISVVEADNVFLKADNIDLRGCNCSGTYYFLNN